VIEARLGQARAVWTDRHGGVSNPPYDTANLSLSVGDDADAVGENRCRLADSLQLPHPSTWWWLRQVHGADTVVAHGSPTDGTPDADAVVTDVPAVPMVVMTADCAPIAVACDGAAGVIHAGWHGLLAGVVEDAVQRLLEMGGGPVSAVIGPCIQPASYEFGEADLARVTERFGDSVAGRTAHGRPALDLPAAVAVALEQAGAASIRDLAICTASTPDYFSYRRDGSTGRQALVVVLEP
jgi:YfiH family protein